MDLDLLRSHPWLPFDQPFAKHIVSASTKPSNVLYILHILNSDNNYHFLGHMILFLAPLLSTVHEPEGGKGALGQE